MGLKLGIVTPVVHLNPRFEPPGWEETGGLEDVVAVAQAADRAGYGWLSCSEHIAVPAEATGVRGGRYWDPFTTLAVLAASTERIGLLTHMVVLGYHHPLEIVKRCGTLDVVSGGRVLLGVGVGSLEPEFRLLGHQFEGRGEIADDSIRAIRASWGVRVPAYEGEHWRFADFVVEPSGLARPVSIWVGGRSGRSLRRALELGDGWMPFRLLADELGAVVGAARERGLFAAREAAGLGPVELIFAPEPPIDPLGDREGTLRLLSSYVAHGATGFSLRFLNDSRAHYIEQMEATVEVVRALEG